MLQGFFTCREMGSQRKSSLDLHLLGPHWFLSSILLATALVLPALSLDSLLCYYCPLQHKGKSCPNITSQCLHDQRCSSSRGHYGSLHILSAQGCVDAELCGSHKIISYQGVKYNVSHTCCCKDKCNSRPKSDTKLKTLLGMIIDKIYHINITNVLREEPSDSCANYTSSVSSTLPATAS
ncbi:protein Bouncer-like [Plectropomus leopardus]|uniref:protein Bouncer-like n=1 Tax=Plectropomus leopardus TaxID=160734 RepID=UPI001C4B6AAC|nr:protein Bouncer-like [Plectropomus leopardus]